MSKIMAASLLRRPAAVNAGGEWGGRMGWGKHRGFRPIGVKLAAQRIEDMGFSVSSGMGQAPMHVGGGPQPLIQTETAHDGDEQQPPGDVPHAPERRDVGGVK